MDERVALNRRLWDEMARLHTRQKRAAPADRHVLRHFERDKIGDLSGLRVCHLQCHIGEDSIALAQLGAAVVGVDCSEEAISTARQLAHEHGVADRCRFVAASVEDAPTALGRSFDVVYTSWGVLVWLPELAAWAAAIETLLVPGGFLDLAESHPYAEATRWSDWQAHFDDSQGDYTDDAAVFEHPQSWEWSHGLGEVVTALAPRPLAITRRESEGR